MRHPYTTLGSPRMTYQPRNEERMFVLLLVQVCKAYRLASCLPIPADNVLKDVKKSVRYYLSARYQACTHVHGKTIRNRDVH